MPPDSTASRFMSGEPRWRLIHRDRVAALFARADSPAAQLAGVPILREGAPPSFFLGATLRFKPQRADGPRTVRVQVEARSAFT